MMSSLFCKKIKYVCPVYLYNYNLNCSLLPTKYLKMKSGIQNYRTSTFNYHFAAVPVLYIKRHIQINYRLVSVHKHNLRKNLQNEKIIPVVKKIRNKNDTSSKDFQSITPAVNRASTEMNQSIEIIKKKPDAVDPTVKEILPDTVKKKSLLTKVVDEVKHFYHGFRLLFIDIKISTILLWQLMKGKKLSRRERRLLRRTVGDIFRLIPFSIIIIVPFMEFLLPILLKLFPGMLPSTFQTARDTETKMKNQLKIKLEMAKFLQQTLSDVSVIKCTDCVADTKEFTTFFEKVRSDKGIATTEEIIKFSRLFEDRITLETMTRPQLIALCRMLEIQPLGTTAFLRFQISTRLRSLAADDRLIQKEGVDSLDHLELQQACRTRGMRALGMTSAEMRQQLQQWIDLSINARVPSSLLLLSRAFILTDGTEATKSAAVHISKAISKLPAETALHIQAEASENVDNKAKLQMIKSEYKSVREERKEINEEKLRLEKEKETNVQKFDDNRQEYPYIKAKPRLVKGLLICRPVEQVSEVVTPADVNTIHKAVESIRPELMLEKGELEDLKNKLDSHKEEVIKIKLASLKGEKESKAALRLFKITKEMTTRLDKFIMDLNENMKSGKTSGDSNAMRNEILKIDELINAIKKLQSKQNSKHLKVIYEMLSHMVTDKGEGTIRLDTLIKVINILSREDINLNKEQMNEVIDLIKKEEMLTIEDLIEKTLLGHKTVGQKVGAASSDNQKEVNANKDKIETNQTKTHETGSRTKTPETETPRSKILGTTTVRVLKDSKGRVSSKEKVSDTPQSMNRKNEKSNREVN